MITAVSISLALWANTSLAAPAADDTSFEQATLPELQSAIQAELQRNLAQLTLNDAPPIYHLRYQISLLDQVEVDAAMGDVITENESTDNGLGVEVRIGDPTFDNTGFGGWKNGFEERGLPDDLTAHALRTEAWLGTDSAYKDAVEQYARKQSQWTAPPDFPGNFTMLTSAPNTTMMARPAKAELAPMRELARALTAPLASPKLLDARARVGQESSLTLVVDSEGAAFARATEELSIRVYVHARTADGLLLTDERLWSVHSLAELPATELMVAEVVAMRDTLLTLADAPALSDEYVGPVVFEDDAARDLFRYLLVPQLEGTPPPIPFDSWVGGIGDAPSHARLSRRVLPLGWQVHDDPQAHPELPGAYLFDVEGTPGQAVSLVNDGIVDDLLMSRVPRKGLGASNGHAQGSSGELARGRAAQLTVTPPRTASDRKVHKTALKVARGYGRDWYLAIRSLQEPAILNAGGSFSMRLSLGDEAPTLGLPPPVAVVRVNADGSETLLRGARFVGTDRWALRDLLLAGPVSNDILLMPRNSEPLEGEGLIGGIPTYISAPNVLISELELSPTPGDPQQLSRLPPPPSK